MTAQRADRRVPILLFALVWWSVVAFGSWEWNPNNTTRMFAAISLVEAGDATIDEFAALTIDKAQFGDHVYTDKAPGMTLMAIPAVGIANAVTGQTSAPLIRYFGAPELGEFLKLRMWIAVAMSAALLTALAAVLLYDLGLAITGSAAGALFGALAFALGTPVWGWSTTLFGHAPVAALLVVAIWAIRRGTLDAAHPGIWHAVLAGAALGWMLVIEHPALIAGAPVGLWALWRVRGFDRAARARVLGAAIGAGIVAALPLLAYNMVAYATPFRLGYQGVVGFEGMNQGLFGLTYPKPDVLLEIVFGKHRGMLWVAPILLLAPFGIVRLIRDPATRDLGWLAVAGTATAFLYNASYAYWDGGNSSGPRHALPAVAFLALGLAPYWAAATGRVARVAAAALLAISIAINAMIASAEVMAYDRVRNVLAHIWIDRFAPGYLRTLPDAYWGWSPWAGFMLWAGIATFLIALMVQRVARMQR